MVLIAATTLYIEFMDNILQAVKNVGVENIDAVYIFYVLKL